MKLKFGQGNAKLSSSIATFSLPAGHSCPFAKECHSKADKFTGKIIDGAHCRFRCFAATQESYLTQLRIARWKNFEAVRSLNQDQTTRLIEASLPAYTSHVRVHVSGDFFSERYFLSWLQVAKRNPAVTFYGYTKATPFLTEFKRRLPTNFRFTASRGGTCDHLIDEHKLKSAEVVFSIDDAKRKGLEIDHDDSHAITGKASFALLLHSTQPAGSLAAEAWKIIKPTIGGYKKDGNPKRT